MLRSLFILFLVASSLPMIFIKPHVGILVWCWVSYMNPHKLAYGFANSMPLLDAVAGATIIAWLISKEPKKILMHPISVAMGLFWLWSLITTFFSLAPERSWPELTIFSKIMLFTFLALPMINTRTRLNAFIYVIALSLGFFGVKGGFFTLLHGGGDNINGPAGTFIGDNNQLAIGLLMMIPLLRYCANHADYPLFKKAANIATFVLAISILGSQSRGALVAGLAIMPFLITKARQRFAILAVMILGVGLAFSFMPQSWRDRMTTITEYQEDGSAQGRLHMWRAGYRLALDNPVMGGGYSSNYIPSVIRPYMDAGAEIRAYHSIYFMALGEHGFVGLFLFLLVMMTTYFSGTKIIRETRGHDDLAWAMDLAKMLQVSVIAYAVGGAFLSLAKFDLYYHLCAMMLILQAIVSAKLADRPVAKFIPGQTSDVFPPRPQAQPHPQPAELRHYQN